MSFWYKSGHIGCIWYVERPISTTSCGDGGCVVHYQTYTTVFACIVHNICILEVDECFRDDNKPQVDENHVVENDAEGPLKRLMLTRQLRGI